MTLTPFKKRLLLVFIIGMLLLIGSLMLAKAGKLLALILLFPTFPYLFDMQQTLAGIAATAQFPLYLIFWNLAGNRRKKILFAVLILLFHLVMIKMVISLKA